MSTLTKNQQRKLRLQRRQNPSSDDEFLEEFRKENEKIVVAAPPVESPPKPAPNPDLHITRDQVLDKAGAMWKDYEKCHKTEEFVERTLDEKLEYFRVNLGYGLFMDEFPVVSRYMVRDGQYSRRAFNRMLEKIEITKHPDASVRPKGYMEDQWARRQADYAQYLWEECQRGRYDNAMRKVVWQTTYDRLKGEFDDFRTLHKDVEERVKEEKKELAAKNARELLERVATGTQELTDDESKYLLYTLQNLTYQRMFSFVLKEIVAKVPRIESKGESMGEGPEHAPKVTMIETVDVNRMNEIDDKYKPKELRGMEPVLEEDSDGEVIEEIVLE